MADERVVRDNRANSQKEVTVIQKAHEEVHAAMTDVITAGQSILDAQTRVTR